jgi:hypothetical protein
MQAKPRQKSPAEKAFLNEDHANWLRLPSTKRVIEEIGELIAAQQRYVVDSLDSKEKVYALAIENTGLRKALDLIETLPYPNIERTLPDGDE